MAVEGAGVHFCIDSQFHNLRPNPRTSVISFKTAKNNACENSVGVFKFLSLNNSFSTAVAELKT